MTLSEVKDCLDSRTAKDAARLAFQSAVSSAITFTLMKWWGMPEKFVGVLSAVLIVKPSVGSTLVSGFERFLATVVGCLIGITCIALIPTGYGTAASLAISMFIMNGIAGFRKEWRYGVVAAVALTLGADHDIWDQSKDRSLSILMGVVVGMGVSLCIWPEKASTRTIRRMKSALLAISDYFGQSLAGVQTDDNRESEKARDRYTTEISEARSNVCSINIASNKKLLDAISQIERLESSVNIINRVAGSADDLASSSDVEEEDLAEIRGLVASISNALAKGEAETAKLNLEKFHKAVAAFRDEVDHASSYSDDGLQLRALQFGLEDTYRSLEELTSTMPAVEDN